MNILLGVVFLFYILFPNNLVTSIFLPGKQGIYLDIRPPFLFLTKEGPYFCVFKYVALQLYFPLQFLKEVYLFKKSKFTNIIAEMHTIRIWSNFYVNCVI